MAYDYPGPVSKLLELGDPRGQRGWMDYTELGLGPEHVPDLVRMALDEDRYWVGSDPDRVWAGLHAWRALSQLRAAEAVEPLTRLLRDIDEHDDDWAGEELPKVFGLIGPQGIPALTAYAADQDHPLFARIAAAQSLREIVARHPDARADAVAALTALLEPFSDQDTTFNAFVISYLVDLDATEVASLMERAFEADCVDLMVMGDWADVQIELGLLEAWSRTESLEDQGAFAELREVFERDLARTRLSEIGRNDPCWCGSGRKYKHCHLREDQRQSRA